MPGAIANPLNNPEQSYMDYTHDYAPGSYQAQVDKGYKWDGTKWVYQGGNAAEDAKGADMAKLYKLPNDAAVYGSPAQTGVQPKAASPMTASLAGGGISSSTSPGGYKIGSQLSAIDEKFGRDIKDATEMEREGLAGRGMLTGMVGQASERRARAPLEAERMAAQERLGNQQQTYQNQLDFAKQQAEWQKQLAMMSGGTYSSKDSGGGQLADILAGLMGGGGGQGAVTKPPGVNTSSGTASTAAAAPLNKADGEPIRGKGESYDAYMARWNAWFNGKKKANVPGQPNSTPGYDAASSPSGGAAPYVPYDEGYGNTVM